MPIREIHEKKKTVIRLKNGQAESFFAGFLSSASQLKQTSNDKKKKQKHPAHINTHTQQQKKKSKQQNKTALRPTKELRREWQRSKKKKTPIQVCDRSKLERRNK